MGNAFQSAKEKRLTHHVEVIAQGVEQAHEMFSRVLLETIVVSLLRERIVENLMESFAHKLFSNKVLQAV